MLENQEKSLHQPAEPVSQPELSRQELERHDLLALCSESRAISDQNDDVAFFNIFGNIAGAQGDLESDIDLRCVCFRAISADKQLDIENRLYAKAPTRQDGTKRKLELQWAILDRYREGLIGKDGVIPTVEGVGSVGFNAGAALLEHHSLIALYCLWTEMPFSHSVDEVSTMFGAEVLPVRVQDRITLDQPGGVEWNHLYLSSFRTLFYRWVLSGSEGREALSEPYAMRLAKLVIRLALGSLIADSNDTQMLFIQKFLTDWFKNNRTNPDEAFVAIIEKVKPGWLAPWMKETLEVALALRTTKAVEPGKLFQTTEKGAMLEQFRDAAQTMAFALAYQTGSVERRNRLGVYDPVTESAFELAVLELMAQQPEIVEVVNFTKDNPEIIKSGTQFDPSDDYLYFFPQFRLLGSSDGTLRTQGEIEITFTTPEGEKRRVVRQAGRAAGEIATFLKGPRTADVRLSPDGEQVLQAARIKGSYVRELTGEATGTGGDLLRKSQQGFDLPEIKRAQQLLHLMTYITYELTQTLAHRVPALTPKESEDMLIETTRSCRDTPLQHWLIDDYALKLEHALKNASVPYSIEQYAAGQTIFTQGDENDGYLYVLTAQKGGQSLKNVINNWWVGQSANMEPAVEISDFAPGNAARLYLVNNGVFGEMALLRGKRTATARTLRSANVMKVKVDDFERFVFSNKPAENAAKMEPFRFFAHLAALNGHRVQRNLTLAATLPRHSI